jgi:hypothetical protein
MRAVAMGMWKSSENVIKKRINDGKNRNYLLFSLNFYSSP